jgi:hypothetical protein
LGTVQRLSAREYNRHVKLLLLVPAALLLVSCSRKDIQTPDAVRQAVIEDLQARQAKTGVDLSSMTIEVPSVTFNKDEARANVSFVPKGGQGGMQMPYTLTRKGDKWVVSDRGAPHVEGALPGAEGGALPPGHPSTGDGQTELPSGHPPVAKQ